MTKKEWLYGDGLEQYDWRCYLPASNESKISPHDLELMFESFMEVLDTTLMSCGHALTQAPQRLQKSRLVTDLPSTISTALHGHTSWQA